MKSTTIRLGTTRYYSPLSPVQIQQEAQQITTGLKWFRNPFALVKEPFEGEGSFSKFNLNYRTLLRFDKAFSKIVGCVTVNATGRTEVELMLKKAGKEWALRGIMVFAIMLMPTIAVTLHTHLFFGFAAALGVLLAMRHLPNQDIATAILTLLQHRLQLTPIIDSSSN